VKTIASQRPSNPVRSCRATVTFLWEASPTATSTVPPSCQCHLAPSVPKVVSSGFPSTRTRNPPGAPGTFQGATQSRVRTSTRYLPGPGSSTSVLASSTGTPSPWARSIGEPIWSMNCWSTTQPPGFSKPSASTSTVGGLSSVWAPEAAVAGTRQAQAMVSVAAAVSVACAVLMGCSVLQTVVPWPTQSYRARSSGTNSHNLFRQPTCQEPRITGMGTDELPVWQCTYCVCVDPCPSVLSVVSALAGKLCAVILRSAYFGVQDILR